MTKVFFEDGEIIEGPQGTVRRAIRAKEANYGPMRYWFRAPAGWQEIVNRYWYEFALYQREPQDRAELRNTI